MRVVGVADEQARPQHVDADPLRAAARRRGRARCRAPSSAGRRRRRRPAARAPSRRPRGRWRDGRFRASASASRLRPARRDRSICACDRPSVCGTQPRSGLRFRAVFAVYAAHINADDPLSGLVVGEARARRFPTGWTTVDGAGRVAESPRPVVAARRRPARGPAADDPRLRRRRDRRGRARGHRALGGLRPTLAGRRDARPAALAPVRALPGDVRRAGGGAAAQPRRQAAGAVVRGGRVPADGVADGLPDAVHARRRSSRARRCWSRAPAAAWRPR